MWFNFSSLCLQPKWLGATIRSFDIAPPRFFTVTEACNERRLKKTETAKQSMHAQERTRMNNTAFLPCPELKKRLTYRTSSFSGQMGKQTFYFFRPHVLLLFCEEICEGLTNKKKNISCVLLYFVRIWKNKQTTNFRILARFSIFLDFSRFEVWMPGYLDASDINMDLNNT